ncbi:hypothetical protein TanjilG_16447 [Lupinus angustifolius]|uniref:O-methyltransferase dimerisation domain-containing protein n=1 Tax=Lupinus angustifolius TaxID=3871 RepID=A0A1J7HVK8_LUPAN|nr:hypothetical protein TanjilG_16447 [Lupinus angustifolius]
MNGKEHPLALESRLENLNIMQEDRYEKFEGISSYMSSRDESSVRKSPMNCHASMPSSPNHNLFATCNFDFIILSKLQIHSSKKFVDGEVSYNESQELEDEEAFSYATQLGFSIVLSMSLQSAIELGVFDILQKAGPGAQLSTKQIASHSPSYPGVENVVGDMFQSVLKGNAIFMKRLEDL